MKPEDLTLTHSERVRREMERVAEEHRRDLEYDRLVKLQRITSGLLNHRPKEREQCPLGDACEFAWLEHSSHAGGDE